MTPNKQKLTLKIVCGVIVPKTGIGVGPGIPSSLKMVYGAVK